MSVQFKSRILPFSLKLKNARVSLGEHPAPSHTLAAAAGVSATEKESALNFFFFFLQ